MRQRLSNLILYPLLAALIPVLALYTANIDQVDLGVIWRPLIVALLLVLALWAGLKLLLKDNSRAALLSFWIWIVFVTYGHARAVVLDYLPTLGRHRFFLPLWLLLGALGIFVILRLRRTPQPLHQFLNIFSAAMLLIQLLLIGQNWLQIVQTRQSQSAPVIALTRPASPPDIYWIVLDGYTRADVLQENYGYDNSAFLEQLESLLLQTTLGELLWDYLFNDTTGQHSWFIHQSKAARDQSILDQFDDAIQVAGPKFVYAHLMITHTPFLLTHQGPFQEPLIYSNYAFPLDRAWYGKAYVTQIQIANQAVLEIVQQILAASETPPVIIIQGDHGEAADNSQGLPPANVRMPILYAILMPQGRDLLASDFSPVNTFRLLFHSTFGADLDLLATRSFYGEEEYLDTWDACR